MSGNMCFKINPGVPVSVMWQTSGMKFHASTAAFQKRPTAAQMQEAKKKCHVSVDHYGGCDHRPSSSAC